MPSISNASSAAICAVDRRLAGRRPGDQLGDHRIVEHRDLAALGDAVVDADAARFLVLLGRRAIADQPPGARQEAAIRVLGIDPGLDRPAVELHIVLRERQLLARRDPDHLLDQIEAGDLLGHRMLDLQPGVHLEEVEALAGRVGAGDDQLDRAGAE